MLLLKKLKTIWTLRIRNGQQIGCIKRTKKGRQFTWKSLKNNEAETRRKTKVITLVSSIAILFFCSFPNERVQYHYCIVRWKQICSADLLQIHEPSSCHVCTLLELCSLFKLDLCVWTVCANEPNDERVIEEDLITGSLWCGFHLDFRIIKSHSWSWRIVFLRQSNHHPDWRHSRQHSCLCWDRWDCP